MNRLWAISDIHLSFKSNMEEWTKLKPRGEDDGLILAGDSAPFFCRAQWCSANEYSWRIAEDAQ